MKAKDIARVLLKDCELLTDDKDKLTEVFEAFYIIRDEISEAVKQRRNVDSQIGVYRDGLTKWKSVVRHTNESNPSIPIFDNIFGIYFATQAPKVFEILLQRNVFLGYVMSASEQELIDTIKRQKEIAEAGQAFDNMLRRSFINFLVGRNL